MGIEQLEVDSYLDALRETGRTNMFGAGRYVELEFGVSEQEARNFLTRWMTDFSKEKKNEG